MTSKDLTKELYLSENRSVTLEELENLVNYMLGLTWTVNIYRNSPARTVRLADKGWKFVWGRTKTAAGRCVRKDGIPTILGVEYRTKQIELSMHFADQNLEEGKEWEEVIRHELAHAVDIEIRGKSNHDKHWKAVAREMLSTGARTFTDEQLKDEKESKYTFYCLEDGCDHTSPSHKRVNPKARSYRICPTHRTKLEQRQNY